MSNSDDLIHELVNWSQRHDYNPGMDEIDYSRWMTPEKQIDPPRFGDNTIFTEVCETCCKHWFVITVNREKKWIHKSGGWADKAYKLGGDGDWYATTGTLKLEIWNNEKGDYKELLLETGSVERGGPGTLEKEQARMIPVGTYRLGGANGSKHSTDSYNPMPNNKRLPGVNVRGSGVSSGRGINIHSAANWAYSTGCILPVPKEHINRTKIGGSMTNLPPNWYEHKEASHNQVVYIIYNLLVINAITKIGTNNFNCAKLIITENTPLSDEFITIIKKGNKEYVAN